MASEETMDLAEVPIDPSLAPVKVARDESGKYAPKPKTPSAEQDEKARRAAFDRVMEHARAAESGMKLPANGEQPADAKAKADAPKEEVIDEPEVDQAALVAAKANAKRLKIPQKFLDSMTPTELVQSGQAWEAEVKEKLAVSRELGELRKELATLKQPKESAPEQGQPGDDLDTLLAKPMAVLDVDEGTGKGLGGLFKAYDSRIMARLEKLESHISQEADERAVRQVEEAKNKLLARCPQLGDEEVWPRVVKRALTLKQEGGFETHESLLEASYRSLSLPLADASPQASQKPSTGKRNGVASTSSASPRPAPADPQKDLRAKFDRIMEQARASTGST